MKRPTHHLVDTARLQASTVPRLRVNMALLLQVSTALPRQDKVNTAPRLQANTALLLLQDKDSMELLRQVNMAVLHHQASTVNDHLRVALADTQANSSMEHLHQVEGTSTELLPMV